MVIHCISHVVDAEDSRGVDGLVVEGVGGQVAVVVKGEGGVAEGIAMGGRPGGRRGFRWWRWKK